MNDRYIVEAKVYGVDKWMDTDIRGNEFGDTIKWCEEHQSNLVRFRIIDTQAIVWLSPQERNQNEYSSNPN